MNVYGIPTFLCNGWQCFLILELLSVVGFLSYFGQLTADLPLISNHLLNI